MFRWSTRGEEGLIRRIRRLFPAPSREVRVPIGDDAAVIRFLGREDLVLTTDQMVEGIHFRRTTHPPELLGARALTVNLSDLASMGAHPRWFLLSLFLPADLPGPYLEGVLRGMAREARRRRVALVGGNLTASPWLALDVCLAGSLARGRSPLLRSGARVGDALYVTGRLGGSALGHELLDAGWRWRRGRAHRRGAAPKEIPFASRALRAHLAPSPDYRLASLLARHHLASAAIDVSDGLSSDLWRLCRASGVGAQVVGASLPLDPAAVKLVGRSRARTLALEGGEDYQLLFTVGPRREGRLLRLSGRRAKRIGTIVPARRGILLEDGIRRQPLLPHGFDHLARRRSR